MVQSWSHVASRAVLSKGSQHTARQESYRKEHMVNQHLTKEHVNVYTLNKAAQFLLFPLGFNSLNAQPLW